MQVRRGAVALAAACAMSVVMIGGADATADPSSDRACADAASFTVNATPGSADMQVSFRVVRCSG